MNPTYPVTQHLTHPSARDASCVATACALWIQLLLFLSFPLFSRSFCFTQVTLGTSHWVRHTGYVTLGMSHWVCHTGYVTLGTSHWVRHTGYVTLGTSHWVHHTGYVTQGTSHWVRHTGYVTLGTSLLRAVWVSKVRCD